MPRVLIIAHRERLRQALDASLRHCHEDVVSTCDPMVGIELALTLRPDVVVVEHDAPLMDSEQVVRELREVCRDATPPVVLISTDPDRRLTEALPVRHRTAVVLTRPYRAQHLRNAVATTLGGVRPAPRRRPIRHARADAMAGRSMWNTVPLPVAVSTRT